MIRRLKAKVLEPLLIPFAVSHFVDEHGMCYHGGDVVNAEISGFTVEAKVEGFLELIDDLYRENEQMGISSADNQMDRTAWIKTIMAIPKNQEAIHRALSVAYADGSY